MPTFILRTSTARTDSGRLSLHPGAKGQVEWKTDKFAVQAAEAEASRARFRDDNGTYCVHCNTFRDLAEITNFVRMVNGGMAFDKAWREIERARVDVHI